MPRNSHLPAASPLATATPWEAVGCSRAQWFRLLSAGKVPLPSARLGARRPVWLLSELSAWLAAGGPPRDQWARMRREALPIPPNAKQNGKAERVTAQPHAGLTDATGTPRLHKPENG